MFKGSYSNRSPQGSDEMERSRIPFPPSGEEPAVPAGGEEKTAFTIEEVLAQWKKQLNTEASTERETDGEEPDPSMIPEELSGRDDAGSVLSEKGKEPLTVSDVMTILRTKRRKRPDTGSGQNWFQMISEPEQYEAVPAKEAFRTIAHKVRHGGHRLVRRLRGEEKKEHTEASVLATDEEEQIWDEEHRIRKEEEKKARSIRKRVRRGIRNGLITILILASLCGIGYGFFVFSDIPFFVKWRTLYIETAMSTLNHQWLATSFIPQHIIDDVMNSAAQSNEDQKRVQTSWNDRDEETADAGPLDKDAFYDRYWELNEDFFEEWLDAHPDYRKMGYENLVIDNLDCEDTTLHTRYGEIIRAINVPENVLIVQVKGTDYVGTLATVKDPGQVIMKKAQDFGNEGDLIETFCKDEVLAINGSGFLDEGGLSNGSTVVGSFVMNGVDYGTPDYNYLFFGMQKDNRLHVQWGVSETEKYRWAFQFSPALIINGKIVVEGSFGWGLQPRSAIGQTRSGDFLMLIIDGRQVGYSIGCLVEDCAKILKKHRAFQAVNMDGGSSSIMAYEGKIITKNSSKSVNGREIPNSLVVTHARGVPGEDTDSGSAGDEETEDSSGSSFDE